MNDPSENQNESHPSTKKTGQGMMIIGWLLVLGVGTYMAGFWQEGKNNPNQNPQSSTLNGVTEVILKKGPRHHYVAGGFINNRPVKFLVDTGASDVSIPAKLAQKLKLERGFPMMASTANGMVEVYATTIKTLTLGDIVLRDVSASINPGMQMDEILLGMSALKYLDFQQKQGELILKQYN